VKAAYELTVLSLRLWLLGTVILAVISISDFVFRRPHGAALLLRRLAMRKRPLHPDAGAVGPLSGTTRQFFRCASNQSNTAWCHWILSAGFSTQWFSFGNTSSRLSIPRRCSAVKAPSPCE